MTRNIMWTSGVEFTTSNRAQNPRVSEYRAHAARISHQRRKAAQDDPIEQVSNPLAGRSRPENTGRASVPNRLAPCQPWSPARRDRLLRTARALFEDHTASEADKDEKLPHDVQAFDQELTWYTLVLREPESQVSAIFDQKYQKRSFHLWTTTFSDRAARFGVYCSDVFFRVIPQRALTSPMLRHMVLAHSFACEHWKAHPAHAHLLSVKALHHYTQGLKAMYESRHDSHDFLAAIVVAFLLEARQNHHSEAAQHITGYEKAIVKYQGVHDEDHRRLRGCYNTMRTYGELWALGQPFEQIQQPFSVVGARNAIAYVIRKAEEYATTREASQLRKIKVELGKYLNVDKDQYKMHDLTLNQEAIVLLLHVTVVILPSDVVGSLNCDIDPSQLNHLLSIAEIFLKQARRMNEDDEKELLATLEMLANTVLRNVLDSSCQQRAIDLLQNAISRMVDLDH